MNEWRRRGFEPPRDFRPIRGQGYTGVPLHGRGAELDLAGLSAAQGERRNYVARIKEAEALGYDSVWTAEAWVVTLFWRAEARCNQIQVSFFDLPRYGILAPGMRGERRSNSRPRRRLSREF